jgi:hypothetical protein
MDLKTPEAYQNHVDRLPQDSRMPEMTHGFNKNFKLLRPKLPIPKSSFLLIICREQLFYTSSLSTRLWFVRFESPCKWGDSALKQAQRWGTSARFRLFTTVPRWLAAFNQRKLNSSCTQGPQDTMKLSTTISTPSSLYGDHRENLVQILRRHC